MLYMETIKNFLNLHHFIHPADALLYVFSIVFIFIPLIVFLYTLFLIIMNMLRDLSGV